MTARTADGCAPCGYARWWKPLSTEVIQRVGRALGAGPLCHDEAHSRRVADLTVYLRQHHAERNLAELGPVVAEQRHLVVSEARADRIDQPGPAAGAWESWLELRHLPVAVPSAWPSVAMVAAHPGDDEVLGVGGTIAMLAAAGVRLRLIAITDGEASHPGADPADARPGTRAAGGGRPRRAAARAVPKWSGCGSPTQALLPVRTN